MNRLNHTMLITGAILIASLSAYPAFKAGAFYQQRLDHIEAVDHDVAHWDPHTAQFTYGSAASANLVSLNIDSILSPPSDNTSPPKPTRKPERKPVP